MAKDYLMLSDIIGRADFLELLCGRCERRGRLPSLGWHRTTRLTRRCS
jgi:hypothetical protein